MKRISMIALAAVAGVYATSAQAADFGGDCCADLEERIAELEATAARKGNRKVSLKVYGHVNTAVMFWDNGAESNVYVVDNDISSTRLGFRGGAKINSEWSAGFRLEVEFQSAPSNTVTEFNDDGTPSVGGIRWAEWSLKSKRLGKLSVGQGDSATSGITEIDLSGTNVVALFDDVKHAQDIGVASNGVQLDRNIDSFSNDGNHEFNRINRVRYDTPKFAGFFFSAAYGEDDVWDVALRYAGEMRGIKIAMGVGYGQSTDENSGGSNDNDCSDALNDIGCKIQNFYFSGSVLHVETGLFVTGGYAYRDFDDAFDTGLVVDNNGDYEDNHWFIRSGVSRKFIPLGKTAFYGEYHSYDREGQGTALVGGVLVDMEEELDLWGVGVVQKVDAAAMELYLGYRHLSFDDLRGIDYDDYDVVLTGARIKF